MSNQNKKHWREFFDYTCLRTEFFKESDMVLTIKEAKPHLLKNKKNPKGSTKLCLFFNEVEYILPLNVTNCDILTEICNSGFPEDWKEKQINLFITKVKYFDTTKFENVVSDGIRIRPFLSYDMDKAIQELKKQQNRVQVIDFLKLVPHLYVDDYFKDEVKEHLFNIENKPASEEKETKTQTKQ